MSNHETLSKVANRGALVLAGLCLGGIVEGGINQMREEDRAQALVAVAHKAVLDAAEREIDISIEPYTSVNIFDKNIVRSDGIVTNMEMEKEPEGKQFVVQPGIPLAYAIADLKVGSNPAAPDCVLEHTYIDLATHQSSPDEEPEVFRTGYSYKRYGFNDLLDLGNTLGVENGPDFTKRLCAVVAQIEE